MTASAGPGTDRMLSAVRGPLPTFAIHNYIGPAEAPSGVSSMMTGLHALAKQGYKINLNINDEVLPYGQHTTSPTTSEFVGFVRKIVDEDGSWLSAVEITNEPNLALPISSDGANPQIVDDLVQGVIAAKDAARAHHFPVQVGFNYVYSYDAPNDVAFWTALQAAATPEFLHDVDWMGLHTYPNYVSFDTPVSDNINYEEQQGLATGRCWATWLGLPKRLPIDVTEVGYPTYLGTSDYAAQADYWGRVLSVVDADRGEYNIRSLYVFLLEDGASNGFGIFDGAGAPKPAEKTIAAWFARSAG